MKAITRYQYESRLKKLQAELNETNAKLFRYKSLAEDVFSVVTQMVQDGKQINQGWLLSKFKRLFL